MIKGLALLAIMGLLIVGCTKANPVAAPATVIVADQSAKIGSGVVNLTFLLNRALATDASYVIHIKDGTAKAGVDFISPLSNKITFVSGTTSQKVAISLINDGIKRDNKQFSVEVSDPSGLAPDSLSSTVSLINDNTSPEINFELAGEVIPKENATVGVLLKLSYDASVDYTIPIKTSGTAANGADVSFPQTSVLIPAGSRTAVITGKTFKNLVAGLNKTVILTLGTLPSGITRGILDSHTIVIADGNSSLQAVLFGVPSGANTTRSLNVTVGGNEISSYRYKLSNVNSCNDQADYSPSLPVSQSITDSLLALPDGAVYLCVEGGNAEGVFQGAQIATAATWTKHTSPATKPTFKSLTTPGNQTSPGIVLSNSNTATVELADLTIGGTVNLFDSATCDGAPSMSAKASASSGQFSTFFLLDGPHAISANVIDLFDQASACLQIFSSYTLDTIAPSVLDVSSNLRTGYYGQGSDIRISVKFSKAIFATEGPTQPPYLALNTSPNAAIAKMLSYSGDTITFGYQPSLNENSFALDYLSQTSLVLSGGSIKDSAGNSALLVLPKASTRGSISGKVSAFIDTTPPATIASFSDGSWGSPSLSPKFSWSPTSDVGGSGVLKYQVAVGTAPGGTDTVDWTDADTLNANVAGSFALAQTYYGSVRAIDRAGNISAVTTGNGFQIDSAPPTAPVVSVAKTQTFYNTESPVITWSACTDATSGLDHYEVALGTSSGGTDAVNWTVVNSQTLNYIFHYQGLYDVSYFPSVRSVDAAGNSSVGMGPPFQNIKPVIDPSPPLFFSPNENAYGNTPQFSVNQTVHNLDIPVTASVQSDKGVALLSVNGGAPQSTATVKNGDVISLQTTSSSVSGDSYTATLTVGTSSTTWSVQTFGCPSNYLLVPSASSAVPEFCVAKYKAVILSNGFAASSAASEPSSTDEYAAQNACRANGAHYDLIANSQYEALAQNIEQVALNWSSGVPRSGELAGGMINSDLYPGGVYAAPTSDLDVCYGSVGLNCTPTSWNKYRRTLYLSSGEAIWDLAGGRYGQWVSDLFAQSLLAASASCGPSGSRPMIGAGATAAPGFNPASACLASVAEAADSQKAAFGPTGSYVGTYPYTGAEWGGLGYIGQSNSNYVGSQWAQRGGSINDESGSQYWRGGVFSAVGYQPVQGLGKGNIRCVYNHLASDISKPVTTDPVGTLGH
jgi:hypothetical protein